jgi:hypothetical protein
MNQIDRLSIERGAFSLHPLGPAATAELLAEVANRIGGLPCIVSCHEECSRRHKRAVLRTPVGKSDPTREAAQP